MAEKGFDIEIPQYCTFVVAEMNRRIKELRVANDGKTEQEVLSVLGKFLEEGIEALACGMVTPCDEYWRKVYEYSSGRLQTANERKKRDRERKARAKEGVPNAEPAPLVDEAEPTGCDDGIAPAPIDADYNPLGLKNPHGTYGKLFFTKDEMDVFADAASKFPNPKARLQLAINETSKSTKLRVPHIREEDRVVAVDKIMGKLRHESIEANERAVAQAKLDAAKVYKAAQDAKPKMFQ